MSGRLLLGRNLGTTSTLTCHLDLPMLLQYSSHFSSIFRNLHNIYVIEYLDDMLIFSESREEHVGHVKEVLIQLQQNHLPCNPKKCNFFIDRVTYIGLVITPEGISMEKGEGTSSYGIANSHICEGSTEFPRVCQLLFSICP
jgi:hypothetical protein